MSPSLDPRAHWQQVYASKRPDEVSWYQPSAELSLRMILRVAQSRAARVIDVGGGASTLVDGLLAAGYAQPTVLDVSSAALAAARTRLAARAAQVHWLEADILSAALPPAAYDVWHDRAVFHFLTAQADRERYVEQVHASVRLGGHVLVATFAPEGPAKCSGLEVVRYAPGELHAQFGSDFDLLASEREDHETPWGAHQAFVYCLCRVSAGAAG
jgi:SAM-dependent methyltransferase